MADSYYYRSGKRVPVVLSESARTVRLEGERDVSGIPGWYCRAITANHALIIDDGLVGNYRASWELPALLALLNGEGRRNQTQRSLAWPDGAGPAKLERSTGQSDLVTFPVALEQSGPGVLLSTGEVVAQFAVNITMPQLQAIATAYGWRITKPLLFLSNSYVFNSVGSADPLAFANALIERHGALFAHPVFLQDIPNRAAVAAADSELALYPRQWHLTNRGQDGGVASQDIDAERAWEITTGAEHITVCIIDAGVSAHECFDLPGKVVPGFDFEELDDDALPSGSHHGTACAALAVAAAGQVRGVAPRCTLMPIRRTGVDDHLRLAEAFVWAADHGADIISCSFGIDGRPWILPDVVRAALEYVTTRGRNGRGVPIFFAAGNGNEQISSDEWASSEFTIAVAASTDQAQRAPYSDFGPEVCVCAPSSGGASGITTAANQGYTSDFGGTSAAAPIAAGVGALVLSLAPHMHWKELRELLEGTARKIDPERGGYDQSGHSAWYGHGQIDAFQALQEIPVLLEVERATGTESEDPHIRAVIRWLQRSRAGQSIINFVVARRLGILRLLQHSLPFREAVQCLLSGAASVVVPLSADGDSALPEGVWPTVELVTRALQTLKQDPPSADRSYQSQTTHLENRMATNMKANGIDQSLVRIANLLSNPRPEAGAALDAPAANAGTAAAPPTIQPFPTQPLGREEIARQIYHSQRIPALSPTVVLEMEREMPALVAFLSSLRDHPTARAELMRTIAAIRQQMPGMERSAAEQERLATLGDMMARDAFGDAAERNPALGVAAAGVAVAIGALAVASFSAGYTIGKDLAK
jgi:subtilisin family serine protease